MLTDENYTFLDIQTGDHGLHIDNIRVVVRASDGPLLHRLVVRTFDVPGSQELLASHSLFKLLHPLDCVHIRCAVDSLGGQELLASHSLLHRLVVRTFDNLLLRHFLIHSVHFRSRIP